MFQIVIPLKPIKSKLLLKVSYWRETYVICQGSVRIVENCDRGLENGARSRRPSAAFSSPMLKFDSFSTLFLVLVRSLFLTYGYTSDGEHYLVHLSVFNVHKKLRNQNIVLSHPPRNKSNSCCMFQRVIPLKHIKSKLPLTKVIIGERLIIYTGHF